MNKKLLILIALSVILYTANIWGTSVYILDEAKNAGCAMEMYQRNDWIVPTFNGELRTDKPPLHYFFMIMSYKLFDVNPFSARLFSALAGVLTVVVVFLFTRKIVNEPAAFLASIILLSSIQLAIQFHLAVPDPYLILFLTTAWLSFYYGHKTNSTFSFYTFYAATGLAILAKGPVALVFTGLIVTIYMLVIKKFSWKEIQRFKIFQGAFIVCVIVLPWYILVGLKTDGLWLQQFFFKHNVARFTSSMEGHGGFPLASFVILVAGLVPFSFFFPTCITRFIKDKQKDSFIVFCLTCMLVVVVFFAFSKTILPTYPEPALPFFAIVMGYFVNELIQKRGLTTTSLIISGVVFLIVSMAIPIAIWFALQKDAALTDLKFLSIYFIAFPIGASAGLFFLLKKDFAKTVYSYAITNYAVALLFFFFVFPEVDRKNPVQQSLPLLKETTKKIAAYRDFNPAYVMGLQTTVPKFNSIHELGKHNIDFVITQKRHMPALDSLGYKIVYESKDLFERPVTVVASKDF